VRSYATNSESQIGEPRHLDLRAWFAQIQITRPDGPGIPVADSSQPASAGGMPCIQVIRVLAGKAFSRCAGNYLYRHSAGTSGTAPRALPQLSALTLTQHPSFAESARKDT